MKPIRQQILDVEAQQDRKRREHDEQLKAMFAESGRNQAIAHRHVRPTSLAEYVAFARGYLEQGGTIAHVRDYPLTRYYTAVDSFVLPPLFGAASIDVLVPEGIRVTRGGWGHSTILYMDGYRIDGHGGLELFSDVAAILKGER